MFWGSALEMYFVSRSNREVLENVYTEVGTEGIDNTIRKEIWKNQLTTSFTAT
jgi:hypothetical protein